MAGIDEVFTRGGTDGSSDLGSISVDLTPLITGTASDSDTLGLFCPGQTTGGNEGCFGSTACRSFWGAWGSSRRAGLQATRTET